MSQRLSLVMNGAVMLVCLAALGTMWTMLQRGNEVNAAILDQLQKFGQSQSPQTTPASDWQSLKVRVVQDVAQGKPASGFQIDLEGHILESSTNSTIVLTANEEGVADFGLIRNGTYILGIWSPWGERGGEMISVGPGRSDLREFVVPGRPVEPADIKFSVDWPEDLRTKSLSLILTFRAFRERQIGTSLFKHDETKIVMIAEDGVVRLVEIDGPVPASAPAKPFTLSKPSKPNDRVNWTAGYWQLASITVVQPEEGELDMGLMKYRVLAHHGLSIKHDPPRDAEEKARAYLARSGETTTWEIRVQGGNWGSARRKLADASNKP